MARLNVNAARAHSVHARGAFQRADVSSSASASAMSSTATAVMDIDNSGHKHAMKALAALVVIFGVLFIGVAAWRIGVWRRKKVLAASSSVNVLMVQHKQARKAVPVAFDELADKGSDSEKRGFPVSGLPRVNSPPPTYAAVGSPPPRPAIPTISIPIRPPGINIPGTARQVPASPMVPTPRTSSFKKTFDSKTPITAFPQTARKDVPRTVMVRVSFVPTLADELLISVGEKLTLLEEYEDGWCQVQRIGGADADKGVIPQFCVQ